jgi:hypothetical protein
MLGILFFIGLVLIELGLIQSRDHWWIGLGVAIALVVVVATVIYDRATLRT